MKYHIIYKITNTLNGRYYIGRHSTDDLDDGYMGSGKAIMNAIKKYGLENFEKEIIAHAFSSPYLWELEKQIVNEDIVKDPLSYNMTYGGKHYLDGLRKHDPDKFVSHQSKAGKKGGSVHLSKMSEDEKKEWHSKGGKASTQKQREQGNHPFFTGEAAILGGKALAGFIELWNPSSPATNKNQTEYRSGDCKRVKPNSSLYVDLIGKGWLPIEEHKKVNTPPLLSPQNSL